MLQAILGALAGRSATPAPVPNPGVAAESNRSGLDTPELLRAVLGALAGRGATPAPGPTIPAPILAPAPAPTPSTLSPIDKLLGGEALAGKKTPLAILAYVVLAILQSAGVAGTFGGDTATPTGQILTTLIASFGGLGVLSKVDRVVQILGAIAARRAK